MLRNRLYCFLSWNIRGLCDPAKCAAAKSFIKNAKCSVLCLQETKLASTSRSKFYTFCGFHLHEFRTLDAIGTRGGLLTAWNPALFDCVHDWVGAFSINTVLRRKVDGLTFTVSNIYGRVIPSLKAAFFQELRYIGSVAVGLWSLLGDFNVLLSLRDKNGPPSSLFDILDFKSVVSDIGLIDLPIVNKSFTWTNGGRLHTLERLDRALVSRDWHLHFPRSTLRALPRPRSDHTPLLLTAFSFVPSPSIFRFETYWLRYPVIAEVVSKAWHDVCRGDGLVSKISSKLRRVQHALRAWSAGLKSSSSSQEGLCLKWLEWIDRAEEVRPLIDLECALRPLLKARYEELCLQEEIKWRQRSRVQ